MKSKLKFYITSLSRYSINEKEYNCPEDIPVTGNYYLIIQEGELWPSQLTQVKKNGLTIQVKCLEKAEAQKGSSW